MFISALVQVFMSVQPDGLVQGVWATRLSKLGPTVGSARSASSTMATGWTKVRSGTCTATTPTVSTSSRHFPFGLVAVGFVPPDVEHLFQNHHQFQLYFEVGVRLHSFTVAGLAPLWPWCHLMMVMVVRRDDRCEVSLLSSTSSSHITEFLPLIQVAGKYLWVYIVHC